MDSLPNTPGFRVLILEDQEIDSEVAIEVLRSCGAVQVVHVTNGHEGLSILSSGSNAIDVVVSDLQMPGMDGLEFLRKVSSLHPSIAIVLTSGVDSAIIRTAELVGRTYGLNILGAIPKPLSLNRIYPLLLRHFGQTAEKQRAASLLMPLEAVQAGLASDQFIPFFQPQVCMKTGKLKGAEALMRWDHDELGILPPSQFLPVLEANGMIDIATEHLFESCLKQIEKWKGHGLDLPVSINVSVYSLHDTSLPERLANMATLANVPQSMITLEITETTAMTDRAHSLETLARLRLKGFGLAIDDYGTGFSSMQQLSQIPFTELKIDQVFVTGSTGQPILAALLEASAHLANKLGLRCVAEGVETSADWRMALNSGCGVAQGFYICKPIPAESVLTWYENWGLSKRLEIGKTLPRGGG
jgi:EAL domain-containing protein (putative c-di-GMP-specific phosphodiesterase class I)/ActR/RegA family two-component response regulator